MVVDFVSVIRKFVCGGQELTEVNPGVRTSVIDSGIHKSLQNTVHLSADVIKIESVYLVSGLESEPERWVEILRFLLADTELQRVE